MSDGFGLFAVNAELTGQALRSEPYTPYLYGLAPRSGHPGNLVTFKGDLRTNSLTVRPVPS